MDENLIKRIPDTMLVPDTEAGDVWSHLDVNDVYNVTRTAINENYYTGAYNSKYGNFFPFFM